MSEANKNELKEKDVEKHCKHFVQRRKRFCRMTVAEGEEYCGEHMIINPELSHISEENFQKRIPCPLDKKHTVYLWNLKKHINICNARVKETPDYIVPGKNLGDDESNSETVCTKLSDVDDSLLAELIGKVHKIYDEHIDGIIQEMICDHSVMDNELKNESYGTQTLKHLKQTSSILGCLKNLDLMLERCTWKPFVGKKFLLDNGLTQREFDIVTKMVSWAVCGSGLSRQLRKEIEMRDAKEQLIHNDKLKTNISRNERELIGIKCKRILDYARIQYLGEHGFTSSLKFYVKTDVTPENVCLIGVRRQQ